MRANSGIALAVSALVIALSGCTSPTPPAPASDAVTFRTYSDPMVGGFCSYYAEDQPGKPCVDHLELVTSAFPEVTRSESGHHLIEITAKVSQTTQQRQNSANPPQTTTVSVWVIEKVYSAKVVS